MSDNILELPGWDEKQDELNRPAIPEGTFLAQVTLAELHHSKNDPSKVSVHVDLAVNLGSYESGWDVEGTVLQLNHTYLPLGRVENAETPDERLVEYSRGFFRLDQFRKAMGQLDSQLNWADFVGRLVLVKVKHEADDRQTADDVEIEGVRYQPRADRFYKYTDADGIIAPRLGGDLQFQAPASSFGDAGDIPF